MKVIIITLVCLGTLSLGACVGKGKGPEPIVSEPIVTTG
jgi:hypothetical protein